MIAKGFIALIRAYQFLARCLQIRTCRFYPSCSQYAINSLAKYGAFKGSMMAMGRILRCNPLFPGGNDPVR